MGSAERENLPGGQSKAAKQTPLGPNGPTHESRPLSFPFFALDVNAATLPSAAITRIIISSVLFSRLVPVLCLFCRKLETRTWWGQLTGRHLSVGSSNSMAIEFRASSRASGLSICGQLVMKSIKEEMEAVMNFDTRRWDR